MIVHVTEQTFLKELTFGTLWDHNKSFKALLALFLCEWKPFKANFDR